jgi:hypothetical protein
VSDSPLNEFLLWKLTVFSYCVLLVKSFSYGDAKAWCSHVLIEVVLAASWFGFCYFCLVCADCEELPVIFQRLVSLNV